MLPSNRVKIDDSADDKDWAKPKFDLEEDWTIEIGEKRHEQKTYIRFLQWVTYLQFPNFHSA